MSDEKRRELLTTEAYFRQVIAALPREERLRLFMAGVGADEEPDLDVLIEALNMPEPGCGLEG